MCLRTRSWRQLLALTAIALLALAFPVAVYAQSNINLEWNRWDAQISAQSGSDRLQISETQEVHILSGSIRQGTRFWTTPVQVQAVYIISSGNGNPTALQANNSGQSGTYNVSQGSGNAQTMV